MNLGQTLPPKTAESGREPAQRHRQPDLLFPQIAKHKPGVGAFAHRLEQARLQLQLGVATTLIAEAKRHPAIDAAISVDAKSLWQKNDSKRQIDHKDWPAGIGLVAHRYISRVPGVVLEALIDEADLPSAGDGLAPFPPVARTTSGVLDRLGVGGAQRRQRQKAGKDTARYRTTSHKIRFRLRPVRV